MQGESHGPGVEKLVPLGITDLRSYRWPARNESKASFIRSGCSWNARWPPHGISAMWPAVPVEITVSGCRERGGTGRVPHGYTPGRYLAIGDQLTGSIERVGESSSTICTPPSGGPALPCRAAVDPTEGSFAHAR
jgi:hypothetical protein